MKNLKQDLFNDASVETTEVTEGGLMATTKEAGLCSQNGGPIIEDTVHDTQQ